MRNFLLRLLLSTMMTTTLLHASSFTIWQESMLNPIYGPFTSTSLPDDYFPHVIFNAQQFNGHGDASLYKMWHQGPNGIALSYSNDGIHWTLQDVVLVDANAYHPTVIYDQDGFGGTPYHYKMWYWTGNASPTPPSLAIKYSKSVDGIFWTIPVDATQDSTFFLSDVTAVSTPFHQFYGFGTVIYNPCATSMPDDPFSFPYIVFYDSSAAELAPFTTQEAVGLAYSPNGIDWVRSGTNAVLIPSGSTSDWDGKYAYRATVIKLSGTYHMFYSGSNGLSDIGLFYAHGIGHATSTNGITWTKDSDNPIFLTSDGVSWRSDHVLAPSVIISGINCNNIFLEMWFSGGNSSSEGSPIDKKIGYATLPN